ncbi:L-tyrosine:2-oxoglutarate aminotransferase [Trametopsis cervina]|nr:L-tyrosine:2-oxoglutarate aminotransferase [Trametopsis cervina]
MPGLTLTPPVDLSHHLSFESRQRKPNAMKALWRLTKSKPNMISLATGDPHFSLYPIKSVHFEVASTSEDIDDPVSAWKVAGSSTESQWFSSSRDETSNLPIKKAMAYTAGTGLPEAQQAVTELTNHYHSPKDHVCTLTIGNMDGVTKCFRLLGNPGDHFLADEFSFNALTNAPVSYGVSWVPVKIDKGGLIPEELEKIMTTWDERVHGRKPHVLYTVPSGQNPTGCTLDVERRKKIYALCQRFDIMIVEDDPYYYLQYVEQESSCDTRDLLMPSFLSMDVDGRVLRVDSFSKIMMPGMRLGWITSSQFFHEHLITMTDYSTQHPHAFGQIFITEMLSETGWRLDGFDRWARSLRKEYQRRRDIFVEHFEKEVASTGYASAEPPRAGMFVWIDVHLKKHPRYRRDIHDTLKSPARTNVPELMEELFERCVESGLVVMPGSIFVAPTSESTAKLVDSESPIQDRVNFLRTTFAGEEAVMQPALAILGQVLVEFFQK